MDGIKYITNEKGEKTAVIIDLTTCNELWEDFFDNVLANERENEPRESLDSVKERLCKAGKLDG